MKMKSFFLFTNQASLFRCFALTNFDCLKIFFLSLDFHWMKWNSFEKKSHQIIYHGYYGSSNESIRIIFFRLPIWITWKINKHRNKIGIFFLFLLFSYFLCFFGIHKLFISSLYHQNWWFSILQWWLWWWFYWDQYCQHNLPRKNKHKTFTHIDHTYVFDDQYSNLFTQQWPFIVKFGNNFFYPLFFESNIRHTYSIDAIIFFSVFQFLINFFNICNS